MGFDAALCLNDLNDLNGQDSPMTCADDSSKSMCACTWQHCLLLFLS